MIALLIILILSLSTAGAGAVTTVTGHRGEPVQIRCNYTAGYETHKKYLCRGSCSTLPWSSVDVPVQSGSEPEDKRFSLYDNRADKVFIITITDLRAEDADTYWCGIERPGLDHYTEVKLLVGQALVRTTVYDSIPSSSAPATSVLAESAPSTTGVTLYSIIGVVLSLVTAGAIAVIYYKIKCKGQDVTSRETNNQNLRHLQSRGNLQPSEPIYQNMKQQDDQIYENLSH